MLNLRTVLGVKPKDVTVVKVFLKKVLLLFRQLREEYFKLGKSLLVLRIIRAETRMLIGRGGVYSYIHAPPDGFLFKLMNLNLI